MNNKYVDFISDEKFLECIKWVCDSYPKIKTDKVDIKELQRNSVDPFKMLFDVCNTNIDFDIWIENEKIRQNDKTVNNKIGEFHQKVLGFVEGWEDLHSGHPSQVDLKNDSNTIFIELKNKHNTMNSSSTDSCRNKLEKIVKKYPNSKAYWAFIVSKNGSSGEETWNYQGRNNKKIRKVWGKNVYSLVTGKEDSLIQVWKAIPIAIKDLIKEENLISKETEQNLLKFFEIAFQQ